MFSKAKAKARALKEAAAAKAKKVSGSRSPEADDDNDDNYRERRFGVRWQPDSEAPQCPLCGTVFSGISQRRHHCRSCTSTLSLRPTHTKMSCEANA